MLHAIISFSFPSALGRLLLSCFAFLVVRISGSGVTVLENGVWVMFYGIGVCVLVIGVMGLVVEKVVMAAS
jgi:hypothetical protein